MRKLLTANTHRLFKAKIFCLELVTCAILSIWIIFANYNEAYQLSENRLNLENVFFHIYQILCMFPAICTSILIGTEYSDGTLRNKLIVGHTRSEAYFSILLPQVFNTILIMFLHGILSFAIGYSLFGNFTISASKLLWIMLSLFLAMVVFTVLFAAISMNCSGKSTAAISSILLAYILTMAANFIQSRLYASEMIYENISIDADGIKYGNLIPNPSYISGMKRTIYELIYNILPSGQMLKVQSMELTSMVYWPFISLALIVIITGLGYWLFARKDIK